VDTQYLDVTIPAKTKFQFPVKSEYTVFAYVVSGAGYFDVEKKQAVNEDHLVIFTPGERLKITAADRPLRFLLVSGLPLKEPVAWHGPIVMNTQEKLKIAFEEFQNGSFIKDRV
jgi:redox-sensitive bicupin YhaK (pirin superfamily)